MPAGRIAALGATPDLRHGLLAAATQAGSASQLVVSGAVPDPNDQSLTITGLNFGPRPLVTLDLVPLTVRLAIDTHIIATAPVGAMPAGNYLLTVSRGPSPEESATIEVTIGAPPSGSESTSTSTATSVRPSFSSGATSTSDANVGPAFGAADEAAAKVGDRVITIAEVDREWQRDDPGSYLGVARRIHDMRRRVLDRLVADDLLAREAAARGLTKEALLEQEIPRRIVPMPDSAVASLYQSLGENTRGATLDQMRPALRAWLERITQPELARMNYLEELMKVSTRVDILLAGPRVKVEAADHNPTFGPPGAPVEIVAFGDFQSAEYARFAQAFARVRDTFGSRVRLVFKHLPVAGPESAMVAEAAQCAQAQGKFWPYHDTLVAAPRTVSAAAIKQLAREVGLNGESFDACVDRKEFRAVIQSSLEEAERYDIRASPSFLVNGRLAPTPPAFLPPFEFFTRVIEEELLRQSKGPGR